MAELAPLKPGLLVLHGNRAEQLAETVFAWTRLHPLAPLEAEVFLVQSNGMAEWLKMALAQQLGVCAATQVELPGRFLWRAYRQVLGREAVPAQSPLDKLPLTWRLMQLLPTLLDQPGYEPLAGFLRSGPRSDSENGPETEKEHTHRPDPGALDRRLQLAERLADLYDQYQVYRSDWLGAWAQGHAVLLQTDGQPPALAPPLPDDQRWQALLWRSLLAPLSEAERAATRPQLHHRFLAALADPTAPRPPVPRRVLLFGMTHVPMQTLQALAALSRHCQVVLAIPNPCRYHWADILPGRELLKMARRRLPWRSNDLSLVSLDQMHDHAHPLLAAWGRQGRDFVRQLDAFDDALAAQQHFEVAKVDLFDDGPGETLLQQVQARIRDLVPLAEHAALCPGVPDAADRSIVFHIAHGPQREVEILHDQLLQLLQSPPGGEPLAPRDVVVMVPDIALFAPAIRSVFGQYARHDARHIPFDITDLQERGTQPLLVALEWLMRLPQQRVRLSEVRDLLDVPAVAARFGLPPDQLPRLAQWMNGAGIRWGLDLAQRESLGLGACGEQNSWHFGLQRMLLGYASGDVAAAFEPGLAFQGIEPYGEVGGLDAAIAGSLAALVEALTAWWTLAATAATPGEWARRARQLLADLVAPTDEHESLTVAALQGALQAWLEACTLAGFDEPVPLAVAREAWLAGVDAPGLNKRFRAGGVTFCTLLPMRAIPFEVVCLLGMNDGDYPRSSSRNDFDLMGQPGQQRPGDRSRRDDDRQLMLEALLSARRVLHISWTGRSVRDNTEQPPSVLVSQLRDYLVAGWGPAVVAERSTEHPLQPFSRRYFEVSPGQGDEAGHALFTHASEWRQAHTEAAALQAPPALPPFRPDPAVPLTLAVLARFLKNPVREFFRSRLDVVFQPGEDLGDDDEAFALGGLVEYTLVNEVLQQVLVDWPGPGQPMPAGLAARLPAEAGPMAVARALVEGQVDRLYRAGRLPMGEQGRRSRQALIDQLTPMLGCWHLQQALYPAEAGRQPLRLAHQGVVLDDWLDDLRHLPWGAGEGPLGTPHQLTSPNPAEAAARPTALWLQLLPDRLLPQPDANVPRADKLILPWLRSLAASACGVPVRGLLVGRDAMVVLDPPAPAQAQAQLQGLIAVWLQGMAEPLPLASRSALAWVADADKAEATYNGGYQTRGEVEEPCLARMFPDFEALCADGRFEPLAKAVFKPLADDLAARAQVAPLQLPIDPLGCGGAE